MPSELEIESRMLHERIRQTLLELPQLEVKKEFFSPSEQEGIDHTSFFTIDSLKGVPEHLSLALRFYHPTEYETDMRNAVGFHGEVCNTLIYRLNPITCRVLKNNDLKNRKRHRVYISVPQNSKGYGYIKIPAKSNQQKELF